MAWVAVAYETKPTLMAHCRECRWSNEVSPHDNAAAHTIVMGHRTFVSCISATYYEAEDEKGGVKGTSRTEGGESQQ